VKLFQRLGDGSMNFVGDAVTIKAVLALLKKRGAEWPDGASAEVRSDDLLTRFRCTGDRWVSEPATEKAEEKAPDSLAVLAQLLLRPTGLSLLDAEVRMAIELCEDGYDLGVGHLWQANYSGSGKVIRAGKPGWMRGWEQALSRRGFPDRPWVPVAHCMPSTAASHLYTALIVTPGRVLRAVRDDVSLVKPGYSWQVHDAWKWSDRAQRNCVLDAALAAPVSEALDAARVDR
jgi:hypothetical protein